MRFCQLCANFFKENRQYYERLQAVRDNGDWEGWLGYFIEGVASSGKRHANGLQVFGRTLR